MSRPDSDTEDTEEEWLTPHCLTVSVVQEAVMPVLDTGIHALAVHQVKPVMPRLTGPAFSRPAGKVGGASRIVTTETQRHGVSTLESAP